MFTTWKICEFHPNYRGHFLLCRRPPLNRCCEGMVEKLSNLLGYNISEERERGRKLVILVLHPSMQYTYQNNTRGNICHKKILL